MKLGLPTFAGKAGGALLGFLLGGWVGMALGIILGHSFDYHRRSVFSLLARLPSGRLPKPGEHIYREALFVCLGHLAKQDGRVSPQEIAAAEKLFKRMKLKPKERQQAIELFNLGKLADTEIESRLEQVRKRYATRKARRLDFIDHLLHMSYADGGARSGQLKRLEEFLPLLDISRSEFDRLHRRLLESREPPQSSNQRGQQDHNQQSSQKQQQGSFKDAYRDITLVTAYRTLGINSSASDKEVKLTYRRLMSQNHPDKLMAQGLTERALEKAKLRAQEIQQAYALIKKARSL